MTRRDPTLTTPFDASSDEELVNRVKQNQDSDAVVTLANRHSGIYFKVVNSYASTYPNVIRIDDMESDKLSNLYDFILAYDPNRGMKLSSYIGDRTDYMCKVMLRRDDRNPLSYGQYSATGSAQLLGEQEEHYSTNHGTRVVLTDESVSASVTETANCDIAVEDILAAAIEICADNRFIEILGYRHFNTPKCGLSWRDIGRKMNLSYEQCRKIYASNIERVKNHIGINQSTP